MCTKVYVLGELHQHCKKNNEWKGNQEGVLMSQLLTIREEGIVIGSLRQGKLNKITDVKGVLVGHSTIDTADHQTGVTVIKPSLLNPFRNKMIAASYVLNGFGKTQGLIQMDELGTLETPIALTNTLNIGLVHDAMVSYMVSSCQKEGIAIRSVNPVVGECNDAKLNKIIDRVVKEEHVWQALATACEDFMTGAVGAGRGMVCYGIKGGIGSASRIIRIGKTDYTIGALVQTNHGRTSDLMVNGYSLGEEIKKDIPDSVVDKGSIMIIIATDLPVSSRQLKRIIKRSSVGLARTGSYLGHGSGEILIGFSTSNIIDEDSPFSQIQILNESYIDLAFRGVAEAVEEAILNSLFTSETVTGYQGTTIHSIRDYIQIRDGLLVRKVN